MTGKGPPRPYGAIKEPPRPKPRKERFQNLRDDGLRKYVRGLLCGFCEWGQQRSPTEAAHVKSKGAAGGDWDNLLNMCHEHHMELHRIGTRSFEYKYKVRLKPAARKVTAQYVAQRKHGT